MPSLYQTKDNYFLLKFSRKESNFLLSNPDFKEYLMQKINNSIENQTPEHEFVKQSIAEIQKKVGKVSKDVSSLSKELSSLSKLSIHCFRQLTFCNIEQHLHAEILKKKIESGNSISPKEEMEAKFLGEKYKQYTLLVHNLFNTFDSSRLIDVLKMLDKMED